MLAQSPAEELFEKKIRPVLETQCVSCHNAKLKAPFGGLRLDSREALLRGGDSGPALAPGDPEASLIIKALRYENRKLQMPPTGKLPSETIAAFEEWIRLGAPDPRQAQPVTPPAAPQTPLWSLAAPRNWAKPPVAEKAWPKTKLDHFVLARLEAKGLKPAPPLERRAWLRRLSFDLRGLPPSGDELRQFEGDQEPGAEARVVERMLASPQYGERMARHWLDLVRFAETNGHEFDNDKNDAWRYRDYLIRAFNEDLPYHQLIREHLAGDLLDNPRVSHDQSLLESPLGTGFLWFGEVLNSATDSVKTRADRVDNQIDVISKTFLGLTVACARCHDHKFDPVPTRDYYALAGILHNTYVREAVADSPQRVAAIAAARARLAGNSAEPTLNGGTVQLRPGDELFAAFDNQNGWRQEGQAFAAGPRNGLVHSRAEGSAQFVGSLTSAKFRMPKMYVHVRLVGTLPDRKKFNGGDLRVTLVADDHKSQHFYPEPHWRWQTIRMTKEIGRECFFEIVDRSRTGFLAVDAIVFSDEENPPEISATAWPDTFPEPALEIPDSAFALVSLDEQQTNVRLHIRGSHENLGAEVPRGALSCLRNPMPTITSGSGRRELAEWLAHPENPLTARVMVNRLWRQHFGQGLVRSLDNFGRMGEAPVHQELLDTLATDFLANGWSLKQLHREMVLSATYRMGAHPQPERAQMVDPRNELWWQLPPRRLEAEAIRDAMLSVSGMLKTSLYGPSVPPHISSFQDGRGKPASGPLDGDGRRSLYIQVRRNFLSPFFLAFDYPLPISTIGQRGSSTVPAQALLLLNNEFVHLAAQRWAERANQQLDWLYESAFGRLPTPAERSAAEEYVASHDWASLCHVLLNTAEFLYVQ